MPSFPCMHVLQEGATKVAEAAKAHAPAPAGTVEAALNIKGLRLEGLRKRVMLVLWLCRNKLAIRHCPSLLKLAVTIGAFQGHTADEVNQAAAGPIGKGSSKQAAKRIDGLLDSTRANHATTDFAWEIVESMAAVAASTVKGDIENAAVLAISQGDIWGAPCCAVC